MRLFIRTNNVISYELDIDGVDVPLSYSVADVKKPQSRKSSFSKTIKLKGTKNNMRALQSVYSLSSADIGDVLSGFVFNPAIRVEAVLYDGSNTLFDGLFQCLKATRVSNEYTFDCVLFSDFSNIFELASSRTIADLNWSKYTHELDLQTILDSWDTSVLIDNVPTNNFTGGIPDGFGYIYGFMHWGFNRQGLTPTDYPRSQRTNELLIGVYAKEVLEKIFAEVNPDVSYTISNSLDSEEFFKRLTIFREGGDLSEITDIEADLRAVQVEYNPERTFVLPLSLANSFASVFYQQLMNNYVGTGGEASIIKDDLDQVQAPNFQNVIISRTGVYKIEAQGNVRSKITVDNASFSVSPVDVRLVLQVTNNNGTQDYLILEKTDFTTQNSATAVNVDMLFDFSVELNLNSGAEVKVFAQIYTTSNAAFVTPSTGTRLINIQIGDVTDGSNEFNFQIASIDTEINDGDDVFLSRYLPKMPCDVFLRSMFRMFNLYIDEPDSLNNIVIRPADEYYLSTDVADQDNWTLKLDYSKPIEIEPAVRIEGKRYNFKWAQEDDYWNRYHRNNHSGNGYGDFTFSVPLTWQRGDVDFEVGFAQTIPVQLVNGMVIPAIITQREDLGIEVYKGRNARIFIYNGYSDKSGSRIFSSAGALVHTNATEYPSFHHCLGWDKTAAVFDLNFGIPETIYYNGQITSKNLWNEYLARFTQELTSPDSKLLTAYFDLNSLDAEKFTSKNIAEVNSFRKLKNIDGVLYRLNEVMDFTNDGRTTKCELIKVIRGNKPLTRTRETTIRNRDRVEIERTDVSLRVGNGLQPNVIIENVNRVDAVADLDVGVWVTIIIENEAPSIAFFTFEGLDVNGFRRYEFSNSVIEYDDVLERYIIFDNDNPTLGVAAFKNTTNPNDVLGQWQLTQNAIDDDFESITITATNPNPSIDFETGKDIKADIFNLVEDDILIINGVSLVIENNSAGNITFADEIELVYLPTNKVIFRTAAGLEIAEKALIEMIKTDETQFNGYDNEVDLFTLQSATNPTNITDADSIKIRFNYNILR